MERTTRSRVKRRKPLISPPIDRFSALPDDVICHVLSFIPTKLSVATSILARRWRYMWTHVPNLDFQGNDFKPPQSRHSDIIHRVMCLHRAENVNSFRLSHVCCTDHQVKAWITMAVGRNLRNLDLRLDFQPNFMLPRVLFTCKTLVDLKLFSVRCYPSIGAVSMPSLKKLHIYFVSFGQVDEDVPHLLSGCPVLEDLIINNINTKSTVYPKPGCLNISSPTLKRLDVNFVRAGYWVTDHRLKINAPALKYIKLEAFSGQHTFGSFKHISVSRITSLVEADIHLQTCWLQEDDYEARYAVEFFNSLSNVKCLKLSPPYPEKFLDVAVAGSIVRFDNLTRLEVKLDVDWRFLAKLLEIADNLEVLIIGVREIYWVEPDQVPTCLLSRLRTIRIVPMACTEHAVDMVGYFLRNAQVLETMEIYPKHDKVDFKGKIDALQRISLFERGSKACQLALMWS